jgi:hypothetical protein
MERSYAIAEGALLDVYCFTPHGRWHDMPANDPKMVEFHRAGFELVKKTWPEIIEAADEHNRPGEFVALPGYEWHSSQYGDYNMLFDRRDVVPFEGDNVKELQDYVLSKNGIMIPHHLGYARTWRGANWPALDPRVTPVVDVFSEHGCSMEAEFNMQMLNHSMGGVERSQTVLRQLKRGLRAGIVASTDNHHGHPANYGEGLACILLDDHSRTGVLDALRKRHTYAVTGDRIGLMFRCGDAVMGDELDKPAERKLRYSVRGCAEIDSIRILRNGRVVENVMIPDEEREDEDTFVCRLSFGWDSMTSSEVTDWNLSVEVEEGEIVEVMPNFSGGNGSVEKVNRVREWSGKRLKAEAFTSRLNAFPVSEIVLRLKGSRETSVSAEAQCAYKGESCGCRVGGAVRDLLESDEWAAISPVFSSPKLRLGGMHGGGIVDVSGEWEDAETDAPAWYLLRVQQKNGHAAWSSPIWIG